MSSTGIIFNDQMDDFDVPGEFSGNNLGNLLEPGKRPKSSATPTIITDQSGKVKLVVGAAGGAMIPSATLHVSSSIDFINSLQVDVNLKKLVASTQSI